MYKFFQTTTILLLILNLLPAAEWPRQIDEVQKSMCTIEYYQPQYEVREIKDDSRIKRKITGILVNDKGLLLTSDIIFPARLDIVAQNRFYVQAQSPPEDITVSFDGEKKINAELVGIDEELRVAFVQITEETDLPPSVRFSERQNLQIGADLYLIQHLDERFNNDIIVTKHQVNAVIKKPWRKILSSSSINPLSAGGLVMDEAGDNIGVVYRSEIPYSHYDYDIDVPAAGPSLVQILPAEYLFELIKNPPKLQLQKDGNGKSWLGIRMQILKRDMAEYWNLSGQSGVILNYVVPQSPADKAGLDIGDIITAVNDFKVEGYEDEDLESFRNFIRSLPEGPVKLHYIRGNKAHEITIKLESAPRSKFFAEEYSEEFLRFSVKELTQDIILEFDLDFDTGGVWVTRVEEAGAASLSGLMVHDLIQGINNHPVRDLKSFKEQMQQTVADKPAYVQFFVRRNNSTLFIFVKTSYDLN